MTLNAEPLKTALSKIAPLEYWNASWPESGPKICWKFFRANPQQLDAFWRTIRAFQEHHRWGMVDNCLQPGRFVAAPPPGLATAAPARVNDAVPLREADVNSDLAKLASEIETRLSLRNTPPAAFSESLLTREGLQKSHGTFEDFEDGGQRVVYLIVAPGPSPVFQPIPADVMLHFEPTSDEMAVILGDIAGVDLSGRPFGTLTAAEADTIESRFPLLWKISEYYDDAYLSPEEAGLLLQECADLDRIVSSPKALRGIDKIFRIARWASEKHYGVLFSAP